MADMPAGANPAPAIVARPLRSASRSMSREKFSWACSMAACPPMMAACATSGLPARPATSRPSSMAAMLSVLLRDAADMLRAMWRRVTWASSCASTDASSSGVAVMAISPRCTPT